MIFDQLVTSPGKVIEPSDFDEFMKEHGIHIFQQRFHPKFFTYVVRRPQHAPDDSNDEQYHHLLQKAKDMEDMLLEPDADALELEFVKGENRKSWEGIVQAPIKKRGHIPLDYCAGDDMNQNEDEEQDRGKIICHKVNKSVNSNGAPGMYSAARKARWGRFWPNTIR